MERTVKNRGLNLELEKKQRSPEDWQFGALSQPNLISIPLINRLSYLPPGEAQNIGEDKNDCVTRAYNNKIASYLTFADQTNLMPPHIKAWGREKGYATQEGVWDFSDRFIAILSGTDPVSGNSLKAPIDTIHRKGLIPKAMFPQVPTRDEYYDKSKITDEMLKLGEEFLQYIPINYEQVSTLHILDLLKDEMVVVAGYAWPSPVNGVYQRVDYDYNHCFLECTPEIDAFDNYPDWNATNTAQVMDDWIKRLAKDYDIFDWGYRVLFTKWGTKEEAEQSNLFTLALQWIMKIVEWINGGKPGPMPSMPPELAPEKPIPPVVHPDGYAAGTLEERKAMYQLAVRVCNEEGLTSLMKRDLLLTIAGESGFNQWCVNHQSKDYGLCQFSVKYYLVEYKMTPQEAIDDPEKCLRIMARNFKAGRQSNWVAFATRFKSSNTAMLIKLST